MIQFRCFSCLILLLFGCISSPAAANELNYPDLRELTGIKGTVKVDLTVEGTVSNENGQTTAAKIVAGGVITQDEHGSTRTKFCKGTVKISYEDATSTGTADFKDEISGDPEISLYVSKEKGKAHFYISMGTTSSLNMWVPTRTVLISGEYRDVQESTGTLSANIPSYGTTPTFKGPGAFLLEGGVIQGPWDGRHFSGSYTVPVLAIVAPDGTCQAFPADMIRNDPGFQGVDLIPGRITVNWSLGDKPEKSRMIIKPVTPRAYENWIPAPKDGKCGGGVPVAFSRRKSGPGTGRKKSPGRGSIFICATSARTKGPVPIISKRPMAAKTRKMTCGSPKISPRILL